MTQYCTRHACYADNSSAQRSHREIRSFFLFHSLLNYKSILFANHLPFMHFPRASTNTITSAARAHVMEATNLSPRIAT